MLLRCVLQDALRAEELRVILAEELNLLGGVRLAEGQLDILSRAAAVGLRCLLDSLAKHRQSRKHLVVDGQ